MRSLLPSVDAKLKSVLKSRKSEPIVPNAQEFTESSDVSFIPRLQRTNSEWIRSKWLEDYTSKIKTEGEVDWQHDRNLEVVDISKIDLSSLNLKSNAAVLIVPHSAGQPRSYKNDSEDNDEFKLDDEGYTAYSLPLLRPSCGNMNIDVRQLYAKAKMTTYDPGFMSTSSCYSRITYIDGPKGILLHRGYRIEEICEKSSFVELSFLLLYGALPSASDLEEHADQIKKHTMVHEKLIQFYRGFRYSAHPMAIMCAVVGALASFYHETLDIQDPDHRLLCSYRIIAKMPTLAAMAYKTSIGQPIVYPKNKFFLNKYGYAENFLYMMFALPSEEYASNPVLAEAMDTFFMLHADHEQNASTSTVRIAGSSHANPFACIASGITALWGPAHGGANEAVIRMLEEIGDKSRIPEFIARAKDKKDPFRLMGFGHRVYKNYDPRAKVMREICHKVLKELQIEDEPLLQLAIELERLALNDEYFKKRKLFPNVDFYSGIVLRAMGIPLSMFTVMFAVARCVGWIAQWKEMIADPKQRIGRPRQLYVGSKEKQFISVEDRSSVSVMSDKKD